MYDSFTITRMIISGISCTASLIVVLTLLVFPTMRHKAFMRIIAYISISDLAGNIAYTSPDHAAPESPLCVLESFLNLAFYPASWLWTTVLVYCLYLLATEKKLPPNLHKFHFVCWPIPIIFFLISIPFTTFQAPERDGNEVCTISGFTANVYHSITYYGLFFICLGIMLYLKLKMDELEKIETSGANEPLFIMAKAALFLYPISLVICWIPHLVTVFGAYGDYGSKGSIFALLYYLGDLLKIFHGAVTAIIFFYKSQEARKLWLGVLFSKKTSNTLIGFSPKKKNIEIRTISEDVVITENCIIQDIMARRAAAGITDSQVSLDSSGVSGGAGSYGISLHSVDGIRTESKDVENPMTETTKKGGSSAIDSSYSIDETKKREDSKGWFAFDLRLRQSPLFPDANIHPESNYF